MKLLAIAFGIALGLSAGYVSLIFGTYGANIVPTFLLCGPIGLLFLVSGYTVFYIVALPIGTGILYGVYAWTLATCESAIPKLCIIGCHALLTASAILLI